ncbi:hypothetical protein D4S03_09710 [bacterium]|nr:MAG: hypothetical protein D4S03_09710 [bacterium]
MSMIIEFSNTIEPKNHSAMAMAIVITACAFFFIPTTLIVLGYYASQPTGTLISPLPQGTLSERPTPTPDNQPIIAADNTATNSANSEVAPKPGSNIIDKVATINPGTTETVIKDPDVAETTAIYLSPRPGDKAIYSVRSKKIGEFTVAVGDTSDTVRYIDYHLVNP